MAHVLKTPNRFDLEKSRLASLLEQVHERVQRRDIETDDELLRQLYDAYRVMYESLQEPIYKTRKLDSQAVRTTDLLNTPFQEIEHDLKNMFTLAPKLSTAVQEGFNYVQALEEMVRDFVKAGSNRSVDLKLLSGSLRSDLVVAGDDFHDLSRVDSEKTTPDNRVEISPFGGCLTLKRTNSASLTDGAEHLRVDVSGPPGLYEGRLYTNPSKVNPEGGTLVFRKVSGVSTDTPKAGVSPELQSRYEALNAWLKQSAARQKQLDTGASVTATEGLRRSVTTGEFGGLTRDEWEQLAGNFHYERNFTKWEPSTPFETRNDAPTDSSFKIEIVPATEESKQAKRLRIFDNNPDTFWECELVFDTSEDFNRVKLAGDELGGATPERSIDEIEQVLQTSYDPTDLEVTLTVDLGKESPLNYITLHPYIADPASVMDVVSIATATEPGSFSDIPEVSNGRFERRLTADVNQELSRDAVAMSLAANKAQYAGQAVFAFAPRNVRFIRIVLRQQVPIPAVYGILRFLLTKTVTTTVKIDGGWLHSDRSRTAIDKYTRTFDFDYLDTLYYYNSSSSDDSQLKADEAAKAAGTTLAKLVKSGDFDRFRASASVIIAGLAAGLIGAAVAYGVGELLTGILGGGKKTSVKDSGWVVTDDQLVQRFDKARYALGIRELGLFRYDYAPVGEVISTSFRTPKPITTVSLEVDANIPDGTAIEYAFTLDDGKTWNAIAPLSNAPPQQDAGFIPQVFHVNSGLPQDRRDASLGYIDLDGTKPFECRFRATLRGSPETEALSPTLNGYRLLLSVEDGLRS